MKAIYLQNRRENVVVKSLHSISEDVKETPPLGPFPIVSGGVCMCLVSRLELLGQK